MRSLVIALGLLTFTANADAKPRPKSKAKAASAEKSRRGKQVSKRDSPSSSKRAAQKGQTGKRAQKSLKGPRDKAGKASKAGRKRLAHATRRHRRFEMPRGKVSGQSLGAPWAGRLRNAAELHEGTGYYIRRPWRAFGTSSMVETLERVVSDVADRFYDTHAIAIGDLSAEQGGHISDHSSHQSGRDVDVGLIFTRKPAAYPWSFVDGTSENLDLEATFVLVEEFARTTGEPGGVQIIFLDFKVQGLLYNWALQNGEDADYLATLFQFPHGRGESLGIVRHEPNHADHLHIRFQCPPADSICR